MKQILAATITALTLGTLPALAASITAEIHVVGLDGQPVANAKVAMGFAVSERSDVPGIPAEGVTDKDGRFVSTKNGIGLVGGSVIKDGYYRTFFQKDYPVGTPGSIEVVLKERKNPIPMFAKDVRLKLPGTTNQWFGYDLVVGDWVAPIGKGTTNDMLFMWEGYVNSGMDHDRTVSIKFANPTDGLIPAPDQIPGTGSGSELRLQQEAPANGYETTKRWHSKHTRTTYVTDCRKDMNYYFRVRSRTNEQGEVVGTYGKTYGEIGELVFTYYLNPTGTRNVEFSGSNLFPIRGGRGQVSAP
jgi:hypothetical protein